MKKILTRLLQTAAIVPVFALVAATAFGVQPAYAGTDGDCSNVSSTGINSASCAKGTGQSNDLTSDTGVFKTVTNVLLFIIGAVSVIMLVIGGIRYTISGGDSNQITAAKNTILYAIVGIIVAILAYAAVDFVIKSFAAGSTA